MPAIVARHAPPVLTGRLSGEGLHPVLARIYAARGVASTRELSSDLGQLAAPGAMLNLPRMAALLADAIAAGQRLLIVGDYDADGATACAVGVRALRSFGARVEFFVPNRFEYGYGLTPEIARLAHERFRPDLLITVDNGEGERKTVTYDEDAKKPRPAPAPAPAPGLPPSPLPRPAPVAPKANDADTGVADADGVKHHRTEDVDPAVTRFTGREDNLATRRFFREDNARFGKDEKDELIAEDSTAYYTYSVPDVIAYISRYHSLWPGDVISMGTAFRPGVAKRSLHTANITAYGGPVSVSITGLGKLVNPVRKMDEAVSHAAE